MLLMKIGPTRARSLHGRTDPVFRRYRWFHSLGESSRSSRYHPDVIACPWKRRGDETETRPFFFARSLSLLADYGGKRDSCSQPSALSTDGEGGDVFTTCFWLTRLPYYVKRTTTPESFSFLHLEGVRSWTDPNAPLPLLHMRYFLLLLLFCFFFGLDVWRSGTYLGSMVAKHFKG